MEIRIGGVITSERLRQIAEQSEGAGAYRKVADFMREAVIRYRGRVHRWELGNEENEKYFWKPAPDIDQYVLWYQTLRRVILEETPTRLYRF